MEDKEKRRKPEIEEVVVFITNTIGSIIAAAYFSNSDGIIGVLLGIYFMFNLICFLILSGKHYK